VPSSTSNSDVASRLPQLPWTLVLGGALALALGFVAALELTLAARGFRPTIVDSQAQWEKARARAAALGRRALILVGDSRMQTDFDLGTLRAAIGLAPVELALDGSSFVPVLAGLAHDERITGTVLVGFSDVELGQWNFASAAARYEADYERTAHDAHLPDYRHVEAWLADRLHAHLASYADGARPLTSLVLRALSPDAAPQSVVTRPDRTRLMDFSRANLRSLNQRSAWFELEGNAGVALTGDLDAREKTLRERIDTLVPADASAYAAHATEIGAMVHTIAARGGRVIFVALPVGGLAAEVEARRYPREQFWNRFCAAADARCLHFEDDGRLRTYVPPDGLHLADRQQQRFTEDLVDALGLRR